MAKVKTVAKPVNKVPVKKVPAKKAVRPSMTKSAIVAEMAELLGLKRGDIDNFFSLLNQMAYEEASTEKGFTIPGIGKLIVIDKKARMGRNPATGETIKIPARRAAKFRLSKACKEAVLSYK